MEKYLLFTRESFIEQLITMLNSNCNKAFQITILEIRSSVKTLTCFMQNVHNYLRQNLLLVREFLNWLLCRILAHSTTASVGIFSLSDGVCIEDDIIVMPVYIRTKY